MHKKHNTIAKMSVFVTELWGSSLLFDKNLWLKTQQA